jgi:hypothetical protein
MIHNHAKSTDKTLIYVEGASHGYPTCKACEKTGSDARVRARTEGKVTGYLLLS